MDGGCGEEIGERHQDAGGAEPALQRVTFWNACCSALSLPPASASDSTVVTARPSACTASVRHERTAAPSISTVQQPQTPCSQPTWVPVAPRRMAEEIAQQHARLGLARKLAAVERQRDPGALVLGAYAAHRIASSITTGPIRRRRSRRMRAEAWRSS